VGISSSIVHTGEGGEAENSSRRKRIDDWELSGRSPKSRRPSDREGAARELACRRTVEFGCYRISAHRGWRVQELHAH
jgi:hypothetical protein